jgi:hypothetical protein
MAKTLVTKRWAALRIDCGVPQVQDVHRRLMNRPALKRRQRPKKHQGSEARKLQVSKKYPNDGLSEDRWMSREYV